MQPGSLLRVVERSLCWRGSDEFRIEVGDVLMLRTSRIDEVVPGITTFEVLHPHHGPVKCLTSDLEEMEQSVDLTYNN